MSIGLVPFVFGFVSFLLYAFLRSVEVRRKSRFLESFREKLDAASLKLYRLVVFGEVSPAYRISVKKILHAVTRRTVNSAVALLRTIERPLSKLSHRLRTTPIKDTEQRNPSVFIQHITETKKEKDGKTADSSIES